MISHWDAPAPVLATALDFLPANLDGSRSAAADAAAASAAAASAALAGAASSASGNTGGHPYVSSSNASLSAHALMGMPVQWKAWGNRTRSPFRRCQADANSSLDRENAWPRWRRPFM
jgi:hypothetical protein